MSKTVAEVVSAFGKAAKSKLANAAIAGAPEDQLRGPLEALVRDLAEFSGLPAGAVHLVGETTLAHLKTRPDYAVTVGNALVGFVEVKAPGKGADPRKFADPHDRDQWNKLKSLPNLIYTDGNAFSLWRDGEIVGKLVHLDGDVETSGAKLAAPPTLLPLVGDFLRWTPIPPRNAEALAEISARLCRLLRDEVVEQMTLGNQDLVFHSRRESPLVVRLAIGVRLWKTSCVHVLFSGLPFDRKRTGDTATVFRANRLERWAIMDTYGLYKILKKPEHALPTAVDLFSGAGGITLGLANADFDVVFCSDRNKACELTHKRNFPTVPFVRADIEQLGGREILRSTGLNRGELDVLIGGPPCQGFSIIGHREIWDPRNGLFHEFLRLATELNPKCVIIENVTGLATLNKGTVLHDIGAAFARAGYAVDCAELLAAQYGVPQMRWRMFFIGWRFDQGKRGGFPVPSHGSVGIGDLVPNRTISAASSAGFVTIRDAIGDLPPIGGGELGTAYEGEPRTDYQKAMREGAPALLGNHYAARLSRQNMARIERLKPGEDWRALPRELLPAGMQRALRKDHTRRYRRMQWSGIARSVITRFRDPKSGEYIHPEQHRTISIREAARIQSFPDWFVFEGRYSEQYDQVGNAVPPLLARAVGAEIREMLRAAEGSQRPPVKSRYRIPAEIRLVAAE